MTAPLTLEEARRDVRNKTRALARREKLLAATPGCPSFVHSRSMTGCWRCEARDSAERAEVVSRAALEAAQRRLEAVESQWIGGER